MVGTSNLGSWNGHWINVVNPTIKPKDLVMYQIKKMENFSPKNLIHWPWCSPDVNLNENRAGGFHPVMKLWMLLESPVYSILQIQMPSGPEIHHGNIWKVEAICNSWWNCQKPMRFHDQTSFRMASKPGNIRGNHGKPLSFIDGGVPIWVPFIPF